MKTWSIKPIGQSDFAKKFFSCPSGEACGIHINITENGGTIESPNYPNDYGNNLDCLITIEVPEGKNIDLDFFDFVIEEDYDIISVSCSPSLLLNQIKSNINNNFFLKVYDRISTPLKINLSGNTPPSTIRTKSNKMTIVFKSDSDNSAIPKNAPGHWKAVFHI